MVVPNLTFKAKLPEEVPKEMKPVIDKLKKSKNQMDCLKKAYKVITTKYTGCHKRLLLNYYSFLTRDIRKLWARNGYLHCHYQNYLLRFLLVHSRWFKDEDIKLKFTLTYCVSPHSYIKVRVGDEWIAVDPWFKYRGIKLGDHARGFHVKGPLHDYKNQKD